MVKKIYKILPVIFSPNRARALDFPPAPVPPFVFLYMPPLFLFFGILSAEFWQFSPSKRGILGASLLLWYSYIAARVWCWFVYVLYINMFTSSSGLIIFWGFGVCFAALIIFLFSGVLIFWNFLYFFWVFWFFYDFFSGLLLCYYSPKWVQFLKFSCNSFFFVYNGWRWWGDP